MERPWVMILCSHSFAAFHTFILCAYLVKFCARLYCWKYHSITGTFTTSSIIIMKYTASVGRCGQKAAISARGAIMPPTSTAAVRIQPAQRRACSHKRSHALFGQILPSSALKILEVREYIRAAGSSANFLLESDKNLLRNPHALLMGTRPRKASLRVHLLCPTEIGNAGLGRAFGRRG